jgi:diguanylate cyclase (GGDEF)-like protein
MSAARPEQGMASMATDSGLLARIRRDALLPSALSVNQLRKRIHELERDLARARRAALVDELTGCLNRRGWDDLVAGEETRCRRHGLRAVVLSVDLDGLKQINDVDGHHAGDEALRRCAHALTASVRSHDRVARCGGDEFAILAVESDLTALSGVERRVAAALEEHGVTASVGSAALSGTGTIAAAWHEADARMLARKRASRP